MDLSKINASAAGTPEVKGNFSDGKTPQVPDKKSIWAEFKDTNNKVDASDIQYKEGTKASAEITKFLAQHAGEDWSNMLKMEINGLVQRYNMECEANEMFGGSSFGAKDPFGSEQSFFEAQENAFKQYENFGNNAFKNFDNFKEDSESKLMNFEAGAAKEQGDFIRTGVNKILDDLQNGWSGYVYMEGLGTITYGANSKTFLFQKADGTKVSELSKEQVDKIIDLAISKDLSISGQSRKFVQK